MLVHNDWRQRATHNSWIILSKFITANRREAIAVAEMRERATIRSREAVFATVAGTFEGIAAMAGYKV